MECQDAAVSHLSWALVLGGGAYLLRQTRECAPYGRYAPARQRCVRAGLGWFLQEVPAFLVPLLLLLRSGTGTRTGTWTETGTGTGRTLLLCTFMLHYFYR